MTKNTFTGQQAVLAIEAEAATYGVVRSTDTQGRPRYIVTCGFCGKQTDTFNPGVNHAEQIFSHFRKHSWILNYKSSPYCSTQCSRDAKQALKEKRDEEMKQPTPIVINPSNPKIVRRVITLLNDHFDTNKRTYESGWSDERVAKEAETSLNFVVSYRKEAYAELAEDPIASQLRADIKMVEEKIFELSNKVDELKVRLDRYTGAYHKAQG